MMTMISATEKPKTLELSILKGAWVQAFVPQSPTIWAIEPNKAVSQRVDRHVPIKTAPNRVHASYRPSNLLIASRYSRLSLSERAGRSQTRKSYSAATFAVEIWPGRRKVTWGNTALTFGWPAMPRLTWRENTTALGSTSASRACHKVNYAHLLSKI